MSAFEQVIVGEVHEYGSHTFAAEEIMRFAAAYDPQTFHADELAASDSHFGGLIASGWHTASAMMRLFVDHFAREGERAAARGEISPRFGPSPASTTSSGCGRSMPATRSPSPEKSSPSASRARIRAGGS